MIRIAGIPYPPTEFLSMVWRRFTGPPPRGSQPTRTDLQLRDTASERWIGFVGDICPLRQRSAFFDKAILEFFSDCELMIGNFEGIITDKPRWPFLLKHTPSIFNELAKIKPLQKWVLSIANNHAADYDKTDFRETINKMEKRNIRWVGSLNQPRIHLYNDITLTNWTWWVNGNTNFIAREDPGNNSKTSLNIAFPHWGYEHERYPRESQRKRLPYSYDLVVGHHSHLPQPVEYINESIPVAWSLGNFVTAKRLAVLGEGALLRVGLARNQKDQWHINRVCWQAIDIDLSDPHLCALSFLKD